MFGIDIIPFTFGVINEGVKWLLQLITFIRRDSQAVASRSTVSYDGRSQSGANRINISTCDPIVSQALVIAVGHQVLQRVNTQSILKSVFLPQRKLTNPDLGVGSVNREAVHLLGSGFESLTQY